MLHPLFIDLRNAIIAGSTGRMAVILLVYGGPLIGLPRIDVVSMLGAFIAPNKQDAVTLGGAVHFTMGVLFAIIYAALWSVGIGRATWEWGLIFGTIHGFLVILLLLVLRRMFPQLTQHITGAQVILTILLNHMVYGLVVALVYST